VLSVGVAGDDDVELSIDDVEDPGGAVERLHLALGLPTGEAEEAALKRSASTE